MINILKSAIDSINIMTHHDSVIIGRLMTIGVVVIFIWIISGREQEVKEEKNDWKENKDWQEKEWNKKDYDEN